MISKYASEKEEEASTFSDLLPVSRLCGFLGAGKTTLLKHILETKHAEEGFKCAIIVNDMAALNIDKSLIDQSALVQTDEVIAMQNGCFCCTLQNDLVDQIKELAGKKMFNYMLIEASGVSEPSQIAPLFERCDDEHDHEEEHEEGPQLSEVARLDTCVTVVDAAEFYNNLESMKVYQEGEIQSTIAELMMEQVEFSNVVVLNKQDLVSEDQQRDILDRISLLNPKAKVVKSLQSKINVMEILNTNLYNRADMEEDSVMISATRVAAVDKVEPETLPSCCVVSVEDGGKKCCKSKAKNGQLVDTGKSQVSLGVLPNKNAKKLTRHETRFGITSFVYRARRPFHPGRLYDQLLEPFFILRYEEEEGMELRSHLENLQKLAAYKQDKRIKMMGELLRTKGFVWIASSNDIMGGWQQAGNILRLEGEGTWMCENRDMWEGTPSEELVRKDMIQENGEEFPYADRRQELVFIGMGLNHGAIQNALDQCLLSDEEMNMGPEKWEESMASEDKIQLCLGDDEDNEEDGEDDEVEEDTENDEDEKDKGEDDLKEVEEDTEGSPIKRSRRDEPASKSHRRKQSPVKKEVNVSPIKNEMKKKIKSKTTNN